MLLRTFRNKGMCSVDAVAVERAAIGSGSLEHVDVSGQDMVSEMVMSVTTRKLLHYVTTRHTRVTTSTHCRQDD